MTAHAKGPDTLFAPAEKATDEWVRHQSATILDTTDVKQLFDAVTDMVMILNKERQIVFANQRLLENLGLDDVKSIYGLRPGEAFYCGHAFETGGGCGTTEFCRTCGSAKAILSAQKGMEDVEECRIIQRGSGDALDLLVRASPITIGGEQFTIEAIRDISHEKRRRLLERLFFHDVMNTAVGVRGLSELLSLADSEELERFRQMICNGATHLVEEIKAQRDLTAAENNELKCTMGQIDTLDILKELEELYSTHDAARGKIMRLSDTVEPVKMQSDRVLLKRVLGNMIKNALEASGEGDTVTMGCERMGASQVKFWVRNPVYVPRDIQLQIFQRSFTTKGAGRGLGTYSMKLLSERYLNGDVFFESSEEHGTTFSAVYPLTGEADRSG